jgi:hypothetical protein
MVAGGKLLSFVSSKDFQAKTGQPLNGDSD